MNKNLELISDNTKYIKPLSSTNVDNEKSIVYKIELTSYKNLKRTRTVYQNDRFSKYEVEGEINGTITEVKSATVDEVNGCDIYNKKIVLETYEDYINNYDKYSKTSDKEWVFNILTKKQDKESIIYEDEYFLMLPDMKWTDNNLKNLYYLVIVKRNDLCSLRNLTGKDVILLEHIQNKAFETIEQKLGIKKDKIRSYIHYRPSVWHLHIHFNHIDCTNATYTIDCSHQLTDIIQNLKLDENYYKKISLKVLE